jgi:REP element-mobilizing transposase RayT
LNDEQPKVATHHVAQPTPAANLAKPGRATYRRRLPHIQRAGKALFVTFATWNRLTLSDAARSIALECCVFPHEKKIQLHATVVMQDYVHMLFTPLPDDQGNPYGLAEIMDAVKGVSSHRVNKLIGRKERLWQPESFDHLLRSDESLRQKAEYICDNPVRAGLVRSADDYPWLWRE